MISSILATDMGCHSDYMQQLGNLQSKIHESQTTDSWTPKDIEAYRVLTCGLLIKCADISNVARPWAVAEKWTYKLQEEFAHQGEMENNIGMETTLFGGPPEIGNMLKLANGQIGFMTIFAHPLFANVTDVIPAMGFAAEEILVNKGVWFTRAEHEKTVKVLEKRGGVRDGGISPRSRSPVEHVKKGAVPSSPLREKLEAEKRHQENGSTPPKSSGLKQVEGLVTPDRKPISRPASLGGTEAGLLSLGEPREADAPQRPNGIVSTSDSRTATPRQLPADDISSSRDSISKIELNDKSRDESQSMRAGAATVPVEAAEKKEEAPHDSFSGFKFATSDVNEPVRTYDPEQHYPPVHPSARSSAPMNDMMHQKYKETVAQVDDSDRRAVGSTPAVMEKNLEAEPEQLTPTTSTAATSQTTDDRSEHTASPPQTASPSQPTRGISARDRALSAPFPPGQAQSMPPLNHTFSLNSNDSASHEGSKTDFRTTIFSNGDSTHDEKRTRKMSTRSIGRKRSKIKMGFAFWKKKRDDLPEESRSEVTPTTTASSS